jgi:hypothetical protein
LHLKMLKSAPKCPKLIPLNHKIVIFRSKFRLKSDDDASKIWIRCTQNSLKKLEGAQVSMQLRGLVSSNIFSNFKYVVRFTNQYH